MAAPEPKVLFEEDPTLLTSTIEVVVTSGSADDPADKVGVANLLAELILRGTKTKTRTRFQSEIERLGASLSARTSHGNIIFLGRVIRENTGAFLKLIEDFLLHPAFSKKEFDALKTETAAEISHRKNRNSRLSGLALRKILFGETPLERPVDGGLSTVKKIRLQDLVKAYNNYFHRGNILFAIASPLKEEELKKSLTDIWLQFPDGLRVSRKSIPPQVPATPTLVVVHKPDTSSGAIMMGQAGIVAQDPLRYTLSVGNFAFGGEPLVSRLFRIIRSELGWTYSVGSTYNAMGPLSNQQGFYVVSSTPSAEFTVKTLFKLISMWKDFRANGLLNRELTLSQESLVNSYPFEFDSAEKRLWHKLHSHLYGVPILSPDEYKKTIQGVSNEKVIEAMRERTTSDGWLATIVADSKIIEQQLLDEQKEVPPEKRIRISKVLTPDAVIQ